MDDVPEMVLRVAKAICAPRCPGDAHPCDMEGNACKAGLCRDWYLYLDSARAAIAALKMTHEVGDDWRIVQAKRAWNAGIDAALSPAPPQP